MKILVLWANVLVFAGVQALGSSDGVSYKLLQAVLQSSATSDYGGDEAFRHAVDHAKTQLRNQGIAQSVAALHLLCSEYRDGRALFKQVAALLGEEKVAPAAHNRVSNHACLLVHGSAAEVAKLTESHHHRNAVALPPNLKISPYLVWHDDQFSKGLQESYSKPSRQLLQFRSFVVNAHPGDSSADSDGVVGLAVVLAPGLMTKGDDGSSVQKVVNKWREGWSSLDDRHKVLGLSWLSDPTVHKEFHSLPGRLPHYRRRAEDVASLLGHLADKLEKTATDSTTRPSISTLCEWHNLEPYQASARVIVLPTSALSTGDATHDAACVYALASFLAQDPQVMHISPRHRRRLLDSNAVQIMQEGLPAVSSTTLAVPALSTSLLLATRNVKGDGEILGISDTGIDDLSCFLSDDVLGATMRSNWPADDVTANLAYRKVVMYMNAPGTDGIDGDGHGTNVSGAAVGGLSTPGYVPPLCPAGTTSTCLGACLTDAQCREEGLSSPCSANIGDDYLDFEFNCPASGCDGGLAKYNGVAAPPCGLDAADLIGASKGAAENAKVAFVDLGAGKTLVDTIGIDDVLTVLQTAGAFVSSHSWGSTAIGYADMDASVDTFLYSNPNAVAFFAAGNEGDTGTGTIVSPGLSKNAISVGSTGSPSSYGPAANMVSSFSSRGPTADGRIKPDVLAPGQYVSSAKASSTPGTASCTVAFTQGTSLSTPLIASQALLLKQYFKQGTYVADLETQLGHPCTAPYACSAFEPSGALIKALLIAGGVAADTPAPVSDSVERSTYTGFGRSQLSSVLPLAGIGGNGLYVLEEELGSWDTVTIRLTVAEESKPLGLKATLVWMDPPASIGSAQPLIHDLDLEVRVGESRLQFFGNQIQTGSATPDTINNVEQVEVLSSQLVTGADTVVIVRSSELLLSDVQKFALVISGAGEVIAAEKTHDGCTEGGGGYTARVRLTRQSESNSTETSVTFSSISASNDSSLLTVSHPIAPPLIDSFVCLQPGEAYKVSYAPDADAGCLATVCDIRVKPDPLFTYNIAVTATGCTYCTVTSVSSLEGGWSIGGPIDVSADVSMPTVEPLVVCFPEGLYTLRGLGNVTVGSLVLEPSMSTVVHFNMDGDGIPESCTILDVFKSDSYGDGWTGSAISISRDSDGEIILETTLEYGVSGYDTVCLADGTYYVHLSATGLYLTEIGWTVCGTSGSSTAPEFYLIMNNGICSTSVSRPAIVLPSQTTSTTASLETLSVSFTTDMGIASDFPSADTPILGGPGPAVPIGKGPWIEVGASSLMNDLMVTPVVGVRIKLTEDTMQCLSGSASPPVTETIYVMTNWTQDADVLSVVGLSVPLPTTHRQRLNTVSECSACYETVTLKPGYELSRGGLKFTEFHVSSAGVITFGTPPPQDWFVTPGGYIPDVASFSGPALFPFWAPLDPSQCGDIYVGDDLSLLYFTFEVTVLWQDVCLAGFEDLPVEHRPKVSFMTYVSTSGSLLLSVFETLYISTSNFGALAGRPPVHVSVGSQISATENSIQCSHFNIMECDAFVFSSPTDADSPNIANLFVVMALEYTTTEGTSPTPTPSPSPSPGAVPTSSTTAGSFGARGDSYILQISNNITLPEVPEVTTAHPPGVHIELDLACDDCSVHVTLPTPFNFVGSSQSDVIVYSNGWISFGTETPLSTLAPYPPTTNVNNMISPIGADLDLDPDTGCGNVYMTTGWFSERGAYTGFSYEGVCMYSSMGRDMSNTLDFEVRLFDDGSIDFVYRSIHALASAGAVSYMSGWQVTTVTPSSGTDISGSVFCSTWACEMGDFLTSDPWALTLIPNAGAFTSSRRRLSSASSVGGTLPKSGGPLGAVFSPSRVKYAAITEKLSAHIEAVHAKRRDAMVQKVVNDQVGRRYRDSKKRQRRSLQTDSVSRIMFIFKALKYEGVTRAEVLSSDSQGTGFILEDGDWSVMPELLLQASSLEPVCAAAGITPSVDICDTTVPIGQPFNMSVLNSTCVVHPPSGETAPFRETFDVSVTVDDKSSCMLFICRVCLDHEAAGKQDCSGGGGGLLFPGASYVASMVENVRVLTYVSSSPDCSEDATASGQHSMLRLDMGRQAVPASVNGPVPVSSSVTFWSPTRKLYMSDRSTDVTITRDRYGHPLQRHVTTALTLATQLLCTASALDDQTIHSSAVLAPCASITSPNETGDTECEVMLPGGQTKCGCCAWGARDHAAFCNVFNTPHREACRGKDQGDACAYVPDVTGTEYMGQCTRGDGVLVSTDELYCLSSQPEPECFADGPPVGVGC